MAYDIPARVVHQLDQDHAEAAARLDRFIRDYVDHDGLAAFPGPERAIGIALALRDQTYEDVLEYAAHAVSRLIDHERTTA